VFQVREIHCSSGVHVRLPELKKKSAADKKESAADKKSQQQRKFNDRIIEFTPQNDIY